MRVTFVQLPVPAYFPGHGLPSFNIPLGPGCLAANIAANVAPPHPGAPSLPGSVDAGAGGIELSSLDPVVMDFGGDDSLAAEIEGLVPDIVAFTLYLWNVERSCLLASRIRAKLPEATIIGGGPEVAPGSVLFLPGEDGSILSSVFDVLVEGEGEEVFSRLAAAAAARAGGTSRENLVRRAAEMATARGAGKGELPVRVPPGPPLSLRSVRNPYLSGALSPVPGGQFLLETMRGCPFRCSYCFYGKASGPVRHFPDEVETLAFPLAAREGAAEIYVMDPSFNAASGMDGRLETMASLNAAMLPVHAEVRPEAVTGRAASLMRKAGFASVEIGLQSSNPRALEAVGRPFDRRRFTDGVAALRSEGIRATTGLILGLPRDGPADVAATLEFVAALGLGPGAELYPLSLLPGTELRERAASFGMRFESRPPYWVESTQELGQTDLAEAVALMEEVFGVESRPPLVPRFDPPLRARSGREILGLVDARGRIARGSPPDTLAEAAVSLSEALARTEELANSVAVLVDDLTDPGDLVRAAVPLRAANPSSCWAIVFDARRLRGTVARVLRALDRMTRAFHDPDAWLDRERRWAGNAQARSSARAFVLAGDGALALDLLADESTADLVLAPTVAPGASAALDDAASYYPPIFLDPAAIGSEAAASWRETYADYAELIIEA
ncbi:MAG: B12-binding domain-containing radical SAM protein [Spirochaetes bacterium]|nr:B12-binding domain-containing radical SAM protein [Spirochaetota bacterium]